MSFGLESLRSGLLQGWGKRDVSLPLWALAIPVVSVLLAEAALFYGRVEYALWIHLLNLLFCVSAPLRYQTTLPLLQPFALLPLFRLVNVGMPTFFELTLLSFPFTYLPLLPALYLVTRAQEIRLGVNPRAFLLGLVPVVVISAPLAVAEYAILRPEALIPEPSAPWLLIVTAIMVGTVGVVEEVLFRGILQRRLVDYLGRLGAVVLASVLFGAMHSVYGSGLGVLYVTFLGLFFGGVYEWTDSVGLVIVLHGALNVFLFALIPLYTPSVV